MPYMKNENDCHVSKGEACKKRWNQLRDNYRRSKANADKTTTGQAAGKKKIVKFEKEMAFLNDYIFEHRQQQSNFTEDTVIEEETHVDTPGEPTASSDAASPSPARSTPSPSPSTTGKIKTGRKAQTSAMAEYFKFKKELQEKKSCSKIEKSMDHIAKFFMSMEETVRTLPPPLQVEAKSKISHIVHQLETQSLYMTQSTSTSFMQPQTPGPAYQPYFDVYNQPSATNVPPHAPNQHQFPFNQANFSGNMPSEYATNQPQYGFNQLPYGPGKPSGDPKPPQAPEASKPGTQEHVEGFNTSC